MKDLQKAPLHLVALDTSAAEASRSRAGLAVAVAHARELGARVTLVSAARWPLVPAHEDSVTVAEAARAVAEADGVVLAGPVHDWTPSAATMNAIVAVLDGEGAAYRPWMFLAGAGSLRSTLAFDAAIRAVTTEANAVVIGRPVILAGDDVDKETSAVRPDCARRVRETTAALLAFAHAFRTLRGER